MPLAIFYLWYFDKKRWLLSEFANYRGLQNCFNIKISRAKPYKYDSDSRYQTLKNLPSDLLCRIRLCSSSSSSSWKVNRREKIPFVTFFFLFLPSKWMRREYFEVLKKGLQQKTETFLMQTKLRHFMHEKKQI